MSSSSWKGASGPLLETRMSGEQHPGQGDRLDRPESRARSASDDDISPVIAARLVHEVNPAGREGEGAAGLLDDLDELEEDVLADEQELVPVRCLEPGHHLDVER